MRSYKAAQILKVNLSTRSYTIEEIPNNIIRQYLGGRGLGSYLLYQLVPAKADPLGEENSLIFTAGPVSGTHFFYSSKTNLNTKSPLTDIYLYSISSGILAHQMKKAGFWAIAITGIAESPTYIVVQNHHVEFKDAKSIWGMETAETQRVMLQALPAKKAATVSIGPAGERMVPFASVFGEGSLYRCFGRGGAGCVMGAKKLKGLVVAGDGEVEIPDVDAFETLKRGITKRLQSDAKKWAETWRRYGTAADLEVMNEMGILPTRNWQGGQFEGWRGIDKSTTSMGWPEKTHSCGPYCPTPELREVEVKKGPYRGARSDIEWETIYAFGPVCGIDKMESVLAASQLCDEYGVDTMTAGITIAFAMECFEKGLITTKETDGVELRFGNDEAMIAALRKLVLQEGFGKELAKGTKKLSKEIKGAEAFAMHVKGMELGGYECRGLNGQALQFAIDNRGGCHHGYGMLARAELQDGNRLEIRGKGDQVKKQAIGRILSDSLILCTFPRHLYSLYLAEIVSAVLGEQWSADDVVSVGQRIMCQERLFNMREGVTRSDDDLPPRLLSEPKPDGPTKGSVVPLEELKDDYYRAMGWDLTTGNPTGAVLSEMGIEK